MYNHVEATGETNLVFQHSEPGCTFCQNFVDRVDSVYEAGGRIERDPPTRLADIDVEQLTANGYVVVTSMSGGGAGPTFSRSGDIKNPHASTH